MTGLFFDTYAAIEIYRSNPNYSELRAEEGVSTVFNLAEVYFVLKSQFGLELAEKAFNGIQRHIVEISPSLIRKAMDFRAEFNAKNRKQALSYADAIGYTYAIENGLEFVTGDDAFKGLKGVRFLK